MLKPKDWISHVRGRRREKIKVNYHASSWGYVAWWTGLLLLHCVNFGYYVGVAKLYKSFDFTFTMTAIHALSIGIDKSQYPKVSAVHAAIAAIHAAFILLMVGSSIHVRKLVFQPDLRPIFRAVTRNPHVAALINRFVGSQARPTFAPGGPDVAVQSGSRVSSARKISFRLSESVSRTGTHIFARDGLLGVDSVYFDHILLLRELVETALQTYQVYRMSQLLPRLWLIRFYVALLVANCWAVPLLHRYYRNKETTRRMLCLLCDAVLDMVSSIGISLIIFSNYVPQYNDPKFGFPYMNWFNDHWLANMQQEFQMMLVVSWGDMVSRLIFALGLLQCMEAIKEMLTPAINQPPTALAVTRKDNLKQAIVPSTASVPQEVPQLRSVVAPVGANDEPPEPSADVPAPVNPASIDHSNKVGDGPSEAVSPPQPTIEASTNVKASSEKSHGHTGFQRIVHFIVHVLGPALFVAWGCAILVVHLVAESHYSDAACELRLKPWLSSKPGCSIIEVNCYHVQSTGQDETMAAALDIYDPERAARIVFRHCPSLVLTPKIQEFKNMVGLKIYNSTVVSWDSTAAITGTHHESMRSLFLIRTFFPNGELPPGLLTDDFPPLMVDMITSVTNLRVLPDDLDTKWGRGLQLALEFSQLTSVPDMLVRLQPALVSFAGSPITSVPAPLFEMPRLWAVLLGMTRVQELPRNVTNVSPYLKVLFLHHTNVTTFWSWMDHFVDFQMLFPNRLFNAFNTPYCRELTQIVARNMSDFSVPRASDSAKVMDVSTAEKLAYAQRAVECAPGFPTHFPLPVEDAMHGLR